MSRFSILVDRFDGGYNSKTSPLVANLNESPDLQDVIFDDRGSVETRSGIEDFTSAGIASSQVALLHSYFKDSGTKQLMVVVEDTMYRFSGNTAVAVASATSIFTTNIRVQAINFQNQMWLSNGGLQPYKWNGTEFTQWGIPVASAPTADIASHGVLSGAYKYVIIGVNSNSVQGDYGSESVELSATSNEITVSDIPVFPDSAGVNNKQICRNTADAEGLYYVVTEISNAQTSYTDVAADSSLVTDAPLDQAVPQYFTTMVNHQGRIFGASNTSDNPSFLWFSTLNTPEVFPTDNYIRIGEGDGHPIISLGLLSNYIIIGKNDGQGNGSTHLLYMPDTNPINWTITKLNTDSGGQSPNVMPSFGNYMAYINRFGIFDLSEFAVGDIRTDALSFKIEPDIFTLSSNSLDLASSVVWKNKIWFAVPYGTTQQYNNRIYQYDYVRGRAGVEREYGAWSKFTNMNISTFTIHDGNLYGGSSIENGMVYELDTGTNDAGEAIESHFKTMAMSGLKEHRYHTKVWRFAWITFEASGDWNVTVEYFNDFNSTGDTKVVNLLSGGAVYGAAILNTAFWGPGKLKKRVKVTFKNSVSKAIQLKFSTSTADQYFKLDELEIFYNIRSLRTGD